MYQGIIFYVAPGRKFIKINRTEAIETSTQAKMILKTPTLEGFLSVSTTLDS
jgi:hypothetical protein